MKLTITGNYLVVTEANNKFLFRAPTQLVRVKERPDGKLKVYTETSVERQNHEVIIDPATATDGSGSALSGGLLTWLMSNTGASTAGEGGGGSDFSTLASYDDNATALAALGANKLYKSTTLINNSPIILITQQN